MSPEFYAIIGVGVSLAGFLTGLLIFFNNQINKRFDRLEARFDRLEARFDRLADKCEQLIQRIHSLELLVSKLVRMLEAASYPAKERAAARRRLRRRRAASRPDAGRESSAP